MSLGPNEFIYALFITNLNDEYDVPADFTETTRLTKLTEHNYTRGLIKYSRRTIKQNIDLSARKHTVAHHLQQVKN